MRGVSYGSGVLKGYIWFFCVFIGFLVVFLMFFFFFLRTSGDFLDLWPYQDRSFVFFFNLGFWKADHPSLTVL